MFLCDRCGLCCRNINKIPELREFDTGDGVCIHLSGDNLCDIYSTRPDICSVDKMYGNKYKHMFTKEEYDFLNMEGCKALKAEQVNTDASKW